MTNREKYAEEILDIACRRDRISVLSETGELARCSVIHCDECIFYKSCTEEAIMDWANAEYVEKPKISKKDRTFLEYIAGFYKYMVRDKSGELFVSKRRPLRYCEEWQGCGDYQEITESFTVCFPMVKWEDEKPWLIEDLKKLEVVEEYENN